MSHLYRLTHAQSHLKQPNHALASCQIIRYIFPNGAVSFLILSHLSLMQPHGFYFWEDTLIVFFYMHFAEQLFFK